MKRRKLDLQTYCTLCKYEFIWGDSIVEHMRLEHENIFYDCLLEAVPKFIEYLYRYTTNDLNNIKW